MASNIDSKQVRLDTTLADNQPNSVTTSFFISNIHCSSCISYIKTVLSVLEPKLISVSPSLVSSTLTIQHDKSLSATQVKEVLEDAGFHVSDVSPDNDTVDSHSKDKLSPVTIHGDIRRQELVSDKTPNLRTSFETTDDEDEAGYLDLVIDKWRAKGLESRVTSENRSNRHIQNCEKCRKELSEKASASKTYTESPIDAGFGRKTDKDQNQNHNEEREMRPPEAQKVLVAVDSPSNDDIWHASLAIGGMTCGACVATISDELQKRNWIQKVAVNLIANSADIEFIGKDHKDALVEAIEDIGYEATIDSIFNVQKSKEEALEGRSSSRTVELLVHGMHCQHCPSRVLDALRSLPSPVTIENQLTLHNPILKITYIPEAPKFTIRDIISKISSVDELITLSVYHPPTLEERSHDIHAREQLRLLIRVLVTLVIAIPTLVIGVVYMSLVPSNNHGRQWLLHPIKAGVSRAQWALFTMATPVYFLCADVFHRRALKEIRASWRPGSNTPLLQRFYKFGSMNMLMSLGTSIAYISSVAQLIAAGVHPPAEPDNGVFYFDSVVFLTLFLLIGRLIESYSRSKTGLAVHALGKLRPTEALLIVKDDTYMGDASTEEPRSRGERLERVGVDLLEFGDTVKVLHGGSPPCDGIIIQGETKFDESSLTGESRPVKKYIGDEVYSGTINEASPISIKITGVAGSSMLDQIVKAVKDGQAHRAPMERIADTLTGYFVPFVTLIAVSTWIIWLALGYSGALPHDYLGNGSSSWAAWSLQFAIAVFVVACPCGLALAAPTALFVGGGLAANHGILAKSGGEAFEKASKLDCIVFDKTGTLTQGGEPVVTDFKIFGVDATFAKEGSLEDTILAMVNSVEANSSHTIAKALVSFCNSESVTRLDAEKVEETAGMGIMGTFHLTDAEDAEDVELIIGNEQLISEKAIDIPPEAISTLTSWKSQGKSVALAAIHILTASYKDHNVSSSWQLAAIFSISDPIRPEASSTIRALRKRGLDVWMLSGDNYITATAIGSQVGIPPNNIIAGVLPTQKAEKIQYLQKTLKKRTSSSLLRFSSSSSYDRAIIAMVGDGINDSPALTTADVGIAIGSGSDIAISSAEFVLVSAKLTSLVTLVDLSRTVFRRIKFNFGWALVYNLIALPVAAGVLYPLVGGNGEHVRLDPVWASLAMAASSISVVCSSLLLKSPVRGLGFKAEVLDEGY